MLGARDCLTYGPAVESEGNILPECRQVDLNLAQQNRPACKQAIENLLAQAEGTSFNTDECQRELLTVLLPPGKGLKTC